MRVRLSHANVAEWALSRYRQGVPFVLLFALACAPTRPPPEGEPPAPSGAAYISLAAKSFDPNPACDTPGCLRTDTSFGAFSRADIEPWLGPGVEITNGYEIVAIEYLTEQGPATATVTLPLDLADSPPPSGFPVVVNAHGTIGVDDPCQLTGTVSGTGLAALFGGRGAIGVAPDYPGLGTPGFHRYLNARGEATSVLDSIRAAIQLAKYRGISTNERAAVVGLSQGGHASLASAAVHQQYAPELDIRAFGASGPANMYEEQWREGVVWPGEHLVMHALISWSFAEATGNSAAELWADPLAETVEHHLTTRCYWDPAFGTAPLLSEGFPTRAEAIFSAAFLAEYQSGNWEQFPFMGEQFAANRIEPWLDVFVQTAPIAIWQGSDDATVPAWMTEVMVEDLIAGGVDVEYHEVEGGEHTTTAFGFLATKELATDESVAWVLGRLVD